jgi:hypothetical protein
MKAYGTTYRIKKSEWQSWPVSVPPTGINGAIRRDPLTGNLWEWVTSGKWVTIRKVAGGSAPNNQQLET